MGAGMKGPFGGVSTPFCCRSRGKLPWSGHGGGDSTVAPQSHLPGESFPAECPPHHQPSHELCPMTLPGVLIPSGVTVCCKGQVNARE